MLQALSILSIAGLIFRVTPPAALATMMDLREKGGSFGYNETGNYVRGLPGGKTEIIRPAASAYSEQLATEILESIDDPHPNIVHETELPSGEKSVEYHVGPLDIVKIF
uniref:hypothetical protein n=1 Tax=Castellaniella defragrans TaxID=75697 RepID=UPI003342A4EC